MKKRVWIISIILIFVIAVISFPLVRLTGKSITSIETCWDSDLGKEYYTRGFVEGESYSNINPFELENFYEEDECKSNKTLIEYYCASENSINSYKQSKRTTCPEGCEDGKCLGKPIEIPKRNSFFEKIRDFFIG